VASAKWQRKKNNESIIIASEIEEKMAAAYQLKALNEENDIGNQLAAAKSVAK
jgi:hypothetical protein